MSCAKAVKRAASRRRIARELPSRLPPSGTWRELYSCTMYDADNGIRTGYCHDDMIARRLGHTQQGVSKALQRIAEGKLGRDPRG